jgi:hypothetical protein
MRCASLYALVATAAIFAGCSGGSSIPNSTPVSGNSSNTTSYAVGSVASGFAPQGGLDCNGLSPIQRPFKSTMICADFHFGNQARGEDNDRYIGHDEPSIGFFSQSPASGNNMQWQFQLNSERPLPATQTFENTPAFWFGLAVCDDESYPERPCVPDSDANRSGFAGPSSAGSAVLELQFYPPEFPPWITQISCDMTHWCAALNIDSLECDRGFVCNPNCTEPVNFAFIQTDGVPAGPPGPGIQTRATFTPNGKTLLMNQGDRIRATIMDTPAGLVTRVEDLTTGQSGFMVASAANGFQNTNLQNCKTKPFVFHPEFATARFGNFTPWTVLQLNVNLAFEIGHFTPGPSGDKDADDAPCFPGPTVAGCLDFAQGGDIDFDGTSYRADWPNGTTRTASPLQFTSVLGSGIGPVSGGLGYGTIQFQTTVPASESTCTSSGFGCVVPPHGAAFYPFYAVSSVGGRCVATFGNDVAGETVHDFGKDTQYGSSNVAWFFGLNSGGVLANPCTP